MATTADSTWGPSSNFQWPLAGFATDDDEFAAIRHSGEAKAETAE